MFQQLLHDGRIGERGDIAEVLHVIGSYFTQDAPHDLARAGLRQAGGPLDNIGRGDGADAMANQRAQFLAQLFARNNVGFQGDIGINALPLDGVWEADHGHFRHRRVVIERTFYLGGPHAMSRDVDDIVYPAGDPPVTLRIAACAITGDISAREGREIGAEKPRMVPVHGAHLSRPTVEDDQITLGDTFKYGTVIA